MSYWYIGVIVVSAFWFTHFYYSTVLFFSPKMQLCQAEFKASLMGLFATATYLIGIPAISRLTELVF